MKCSINWPTEPYKSNILVLYAALLHVLAVYISGHQFTKRIKRERPLTRFILFVNWSPTDDGWLNSQNMQQCWIKNQYTKSIWLCLSVNISLYCIPFVFKNFTLLYISISFFRAHPSKQLMVYQQWYNYQSSRHPVHKLWQGRPREFCWSRAKPLQMPVSMEQFFSELAVCLLFH